LTSSGWWAEVDISAPGVDALSYLPGGQLAAYSGTSFAAPYVAVLAAFHLSQTPDLTPEEVEALCSRSLPTPRQPRLWFPDYSIRILLLDSYNLM